MAKKKVENKDIAGNDLFIGIKDNALTLLSALDKIDDKLKEILKTNIALSKNKPLEGYEDIQKAEKGIRDVEKASEGLTENEKKRVKILKSLVEIETEESKVNAILEAQLTRKKKELKELAQIEVDRERGIKTLTKAEKNAAKESEKALKQQATEAKRIAAEQEKARKDALKKSENEAKRREATAKRIASEQKKLAKEKERAEKQAAAQAKREAHLNREYVKQSKALNDARNRYKDLFLETEKNRKGLKGLVFRFTSAGKELRKLGKEVSESDKKLKNLDKTLGQNQRSVGDYERATKKLNATLTKLGVVALVIKAFDSFRQAFSANSDTSAAFDKILGRLTITITVLVKRLGESLPIIKDLFSSLLNTFSSGLLELRLLGAEIKNIFGDNQAQVDALNKSISDLKKEQENNKGFEDLAKAFEGVGDEISETIEKNDRYIDSVIRTRKAIIALNSELSKEADTIDSLSDEVKEITKDNESLIEAEVRLEEQSESNFVSLEKRAKATKDLLVLRAEFAKRTLQIAQLERNLAAERAAIFPKDIAAQEALGEAQTKLAQAQAESTKLRVLSLRDLRDIETDIIERNLDFIIDDFDRRKAVNEDIIADETVSFAKREALSRQNLRLTKRFIEDSEDEINKGIEAGKAKLDFDELVLISDSKVIAERIQNSGLNDKLAARALEIIEKRIQFNRDLEESERDLSRARQEGREIEADIALQLEALEAIRENRVLFNKEFKELEEARSKQQIENITERLKNVEEGSAEELKLRQELFNALLDQEQKQGEKLIAQRVKLQEAASTVITAFGEKLFENELNRLDKELEAVKSRSNELRALAANNVESATENLAFQQKREAEIERERERTRQKQAKSKAFLTLLDTASAKAAAGDENAIVNTIFDAQVLKAFVQTLPSFYEGTDLTQKGNIDSKGGFISVLHPNEMVFSNDDLGDMGNPTTRSEIKTGFNLGKAMMSQVQTVSTTNQNAYDNRVIDRLDRVEKAISSKPVFTGFSYDQLGRVVSDIINEGNKTIRNHRRVRKH